MQVQVPAADHGQAVTRPQEARVGVDEGRRKQPLAQQALPVVEVGEDQVEQARPLRQAGLEAQPTPSGATGSGTMSSCHGRSMPSGSP